MFTRLEVHKTKYINLPNYQFIPWYYSHILWGYLNIDMYHHFWGFLYFLSFIMIFSDCYYSPFIANATMITKSLKIKLTFSLHRKQKYNLRINHFINYLLQVVKDYHLRLIWELKLSLYIYLDHRWNDFHYCKKGAHRWEDWQSIFCSIFVYNLALNGYKIQKVCLFSLVNIWLTFRNFANVIGKLQYSSETNYSIILLKMQLFFT